MQPLDYEVLDKLNQLRQSGAISEVEFEREKAKILNQQSYRTIDKDLLGLDANTYCMLMHLSQLIPVPGVGMLVPIVMWVINKDKSAIVDIHGRIIINWTISVLIYLMLSGILAFMLIGIPLLIICGFLCLLFPIIGAVKASSGTLWKYPLSINFMKVNSWENQAISII